LPGFAVPSKQPIFVKNSETDRNVELKFPVTMQERLELGPERVRFPATREEFWELLEVCEYPIDLLNFTQT